MAASHAPVQHQHAISPLSFRAFGSMLCGVGPHLLQEPDDAELTDDDLSGAEDLAGDQHPVAALCPAGIDCILLQGPWHGPAPLCGLSLVCPPQHCIGSRTAAWSWCLPHRCLFRASRPGRMTTPAHHCSYVSRRGGCCRALAAGCPEPGGWQLCAAKLKTSCHYPDRITSTRSQAGFSERLACWLALAPVLSVIQVSVVNL